MSQLSALNMRRLRPHEPWGYYATALMLVLAGFVVRLALEPTFGAAHTYTVFYPVVIVAAYFLGARPAALAALLSAGVAYWCFSAPGLQWKTDVSSLVSLVFFGFTSAVSIYFITGMSRALKDLGVSQRRAEALAKSHAELFRELNERVTNHLQLVAALLQLQARDEQDQSVARALAEASARTLLISRVHRNLAGDAAGLLDFDSFARQLLDATLAAHGDPAAQVIVAEEGVRLPLDQATSVAIVLLECLNARLRLTPSAAMQVRLRGDEREAVLRVSETWEQGGAPVAPDIRRYLIEAMVEQLGGRFSYRSDHHGFESELVFPRSPFPETAVQGAATARPTLH